MQQIISVGLLVVYIKGLVTLWQIEWTFGFIVSLFLPPVAIIYEIGTWFGGW